ncbi:MAG: Peptidoglycan glycosyltransferase [Berkelbacteria bacterium GW2011_GWA2_35_9]|uniref:Peptidoglycan glycosyltransferase n=1 Tax=Berkelbacteria bacterium GW2011_GWA2_35_9 TaxID=1618333 RepID=A0A0G0D3V3_9BACT|nr:MAG: Peptidoglycan glycosyltransferase [Berkelbacteria bacterium GW2011_GWA2_35_9]
MLKIENKDREFSIFVNPAVSFAYEPGSIFKPIIVSLGLDNEKFEPETKGGPFSNMTVVQGYEIHTALDKGYGDETVTQILENSDNVGMVWVGNQIGNDLMREGLEKFGFNEKTGIDLPGETTGTILSLKNWRDIHRANISFGQGVLVTPLQIAQAYATIANDGEMPKLHIVDKIIRKDGSEELIENSIVRRVIKTETANEVRRMMQSVVDVGQSSKAKIEGYNIGGKTGTAQIAKKDGTGYEDNSFNHSFAGIGPIANPKFVVVIRLEKPTATRFADSTALPMFKKAMQFLLSYYQIPKDY